MEQAYEDEDGNEDGNDEDEECKSHANVSLFFFLFSPFSLFQLEWLNIRLLSFTSSKCVIKSVLKVKI